MTRNEFIQRTVIALMAQSVSPDPKRAWQDATALADAAPGGTFDAVQAARLAASGGGKLVTGPLPTTLPGYGRAKGEPIAGTARENLHYYIAGCQRTLADESKARFHDKERAMLAALEAELAKPSPREDDPPEPERERRPWPNDPPPNPDDIPF